MGAPLVALPGACIDEPPQKAGDDAPSIEAARRHLDVLRARFPSTLSAPGARPSFDVSPSGRLRVTTSARDVTAEVELPARANGEAVVMDRASKRAVRFSLEGASDGAAVVDKDLVLYRGGAPSGGDVIHRAGPSGTEDLIAFDAPPPREQLTYKTDVSAFAGLRLVSGALEMLDARGVPLVRVAPPYVIDASGARREASLTIAGCAFDASPRAPFGRPVTSPGAASCSIVVSWRGAGVRYPALVDPVWSSTQNTLVTARTHHTITLLNPTDPKSLALVAGGFASVGGVALASAELYDPLSRRFTATGSMTVARGAHTATLLAKVVTPPQFTPARPVLVAGGADSFNAPLASLEVYDPATGIFVVDGNAMGGPRFEHTATLFDDNQVLLAGGTTVPLNQPTNTSYEYAFTSLNGNPPTSVTSTLAVVAASMTSSRTAHADVRLGTGQVLLTGGFVLAGNALQALQSAELYDPITKTYSGIQNAGGGLVNMSVQRGYHTATLLANGQVMLTGGLSKNPGGIYTNTVDLYVDGTQGAMKGFIPQPTPITMATGRSNHSATLLTTGDLLVAGGFTTGGASTSSAEIYSPSTQTFSPLGALAPMLARGEHAALLVNAGDSIAAGKSVLVTGGASSSTLGAGAIANAQILLKVNGDGCTIGSECLSGFCADGVCCDTACDEDCYSCTAALKEAGGADGACGPTKAGELLPVYCYYDTLNDDNVEVHGECNGLGGAIPAAGTHSCKPGVCGQGGLCSTFCLTTADCSSTGWCDLSSPPDGGAPDGGAAGTCQSQKEFSLPCTADEQCKKGNDNDGKVRHCIDGVCCNDECASQCQACDLVGKVGTCSEVGSQLAPEDPHPGGLITRTPCAGTVNGVKTACAGTCQGVPDVCIYPTAMTALQTNECKDMSGGASTLTAYPCDGAGANTVVNADCGSFLCADASTCKTTCTQDADCVQDAVCIEKAGSGKECTPLTGPLCDGDHTLRQPLAMGGNVECPDHYACPAGATACLTQCESVADCVSPYVCNGQKVCTEEPSAPTELPSCSAAPARSSNDGRALLVLAGLAIGASIRLRRRDQPLS